VIASSILEVCGVIVLAAGPLHLCLHHSPSSLRRLSRSNPLGNNPPLSHPLNEIYMSQWQQYSEGSGRETVDLGIR